MDNIQIYLGVIIALKYPIEETVISTKRVKVNPDGEEFEPHMEFCPFSGEKLKTIEKTIKTNVMKISQTSLEDIWFDAYPNSNDCMIFAPQAFGMASDNYIHNESDEYKILMPMTNKYGVDWGTVSKIINPKTYIYDFIVNYEKFIDELKKYYNTVEVKFMFTDYTY